MDGEGEHRVKERVHTKGKERMEERIEVERVHTTGKGVGLCRWL